MPNDRQGRGVTVTQTDTTTEAGTVYRSDNVYAMWKRAEARRSIATICGLPVLELRDEPRNPDGTRPFCALLDAKPKGTRR